MEVVLITTDVVEISLAKNLLDSNSIRFFTFDENISSIEGSINVFPIRLVVLDADVAKSRELLIMHGLEVP